MFLDKYDREHAQALLEKIAKAEGITEKLQVCELPYGDTKENIFVICIFAEGMTNNVLDITIIDDTVTFNVCDNSRAMAEKSDYNLYPIDTLQNAIEYAQKLQ
jgi:hypothetical protein